MYYTEHYGTSVLQLNIRVVTPNQVSSLAVFSALTISL